MLDRVLTTIKKYNMIKAGDKVVCALSGGADSMALLYVLYKLRDKLQFELYAAHLNHSIRGKDADEDSEFVKDFCQKIGVEIFTKKVDVPLLAKEKSIGEEECGRFERYLFFDEVCKELGGGIIATGHHINDRVETVLLNLFRGSGGLRGIPFKRDNIIRPLVNVSKKEIEAYLVKQGITWREDYTNKDSTYTRNNIRNVIIKEIEKTFPKAVKKIAMSEEFAKSDDEYLCALATKTGAFDGEKIIIDKFLPLHDSLKRRVCVNALKGWGVEEIDSKSIEALEDVILSQTGKERDLGSGVKIVKEYSYVVKTDGKKCKNYEECIIKLGENLELSVKIGLWNVKTVDKSEKIRDNKLIAVFDADKLGEEVSIRTRCDGDYIYPFGMNGRKKLKSLFIDMKIPKGKRDEITLIAKGCEVLFIPGIRKSKNYLPDENTKRFLVAEYKKV
ncbi:MAG: tRNA lysidine(34) synthetase TilS [Clostridia bacterium]